MTEKEYPRGQITEEFTHPQLIKNTEDMSSKLPILPSFFSQWDLQ